MMTISKSYSINLFISVGLVALIFFAGIQNNLPDNPMQAFKSDTIMKAFPQGWTFFSKSPRDQVTLLLGTDGQSAVSWPNNNTKNFFGISRDGRAQGIEMGLLTTQVPDSSWFKCDEDTSACLKQDIKPVSVTNTTPQPTLCGTYYIVNRQPVPWAWADLVKKEEMPSKIAKVESACTKN